MKTKIMNLDNVYTFTGYATVAVEKKPTGLNVVLEILAYHLKLMPRQ